MAGHYRRATEANGVLSERSESKDLKLYRHAKAVSPKQCEGGARLEHCEGGPLNIASQLRHAKRLRLQ
jgi:hypothetical protein